MGRPQGERSGNGHEPADAQRDRVTPVWRRLRAEHRRALRWSEGGQPRDWFYLRQRHRGAQGRGGDERESGRSHLVGPARLDPDRRCAGGRRVLPRAVRERDRRQAPAGAHRMRDGLERTLSDGQRAAARARRAGRARRDRSRQRAGNAARAGRAVDRAQRQPDGARDRVRTALQRRVCAHVRRRIHAHGAGRAGCERAHAHRGRGADRGHAQRRRRRPSGSSPAPTTRACGWRRARSTRRRCTTASRWPSPPAARCCRSRLRRGPCPPPPLRPPPSPPPAPRPEDDRRC